MAHKTEAPPASGTGQKENDTFLAKGKRGETYLREERDTTVLVKVKNPASAADTIANEAAYTERLNTVGVGPKFIRYDEMKGELVREYVDGLEFRKWLPAAEKEAVRDVLLSVLQQCRAMDAAGVTKEEMTRPWKHIIIAVSGEAYLIDFERCSASTSPKNVTQFCQFLTGTRLTLALRAKGLRIDARKLLESAKSYKDALKSTDTKKADHAFQHIMEGVRNA